MGFLKLLEGIRFEPLTSIMSLVTYLGDELCFMAIAMLFFWCINKRQGYYLFVVGIFGNVLNQFLKLTFRIPRPWVLDGEFTIVEAAREAATGYSFPSGHTQTAVGTFGAILLSRREKWLCIVCAVFIVLVPFSRMYLGVHTPLDVGVSFVIAALLLLALYPFFSEMRCDCCIPRVLLLLFAFSVAYMLFVLLSNFPADIDPHNLASGTKNAYTLSGTALGLLAVYHYDKQQLNFETEAPLLGQILKYVIGLALVVAIKAGLKPILALAIPEQPANFIRYFLMVMFAGYFWPMTFPFFKKLGAKSLKN